MEAEPVIATVEDGIGTLVLNRPDVSNVLSDGMLDELIKHSALFERDSRVRCVVLSARGKHFMAGADLKEFHSNLVRRRNDFVAGREQDVIRAHQLIYQLRRMPKPVIASVQGSAIGIGFSFVLACDLAIAAASASFSLAYCHVGLSADGGSTYALPRIVGERKVLEIALLGEKLSAQQALELGLINRLVDDSALEERTAELARRLANGPTVALGLTKRLIRSSFDDCWDAHSHREAESFAVATSTEDHLEATAAFLEKRKSVFSGR
jgi:2-(1,2-epoxy-1,2-dihydrophenyl)acetyl-CoA isomerase